MQLQPPTFSQCLFLTYVSTLLLAACSATEARSASAAVAGDANRPNVQRLSYADAFPQDRVRRIDINISGENWQKMLADMTEMLGQFGSTGTNSLGNAGPALSGGGAMGSMPMGGPRFGQAGMPTRFPSGSAQAQNGPASMVPKGFAGGGASATQPDAPSVAPMPAQAGNAGGLSVGADAMGLGSIDLVARTPVYVECDITSEDVTLRHVGIRFKGNSSLAMPWQQGNWKLPLRLKFDQFGESYPETKNQRYFGFENLSLSNGQADQSLLRDKIGTELFALAGLPSSASAFYRVYIDHGEGLTYFGLYTGIELPQDETFLERTFASHNGNLYKPDGAGARFDTYDQAALEKANHEDTADYSDVLGLYDALHASRNDPATWRDALEARFDVNAFLHWLALNTVAEDWDSYGQMAHNYYLYADPAASGRLTWIPWDHSYAFSDAPRSLSLGLSEVTESWPLIRFLLDDPKYSELYRDFVAQAAAEEYAPAWATSRFQAAHALIEPYVVGTTGELSGYGFVASEASFDAALTGLISHVQERQHDVALFMGH